MGIFSVNLLWLTCLLDMGALKAYLKPIGAQNNRARQQDKQNKKQASTTASTARTGPFSPPAKRILQPVE